MIVGQTLNKVRKPRFPNRGGSASLNWTPQSDISTYGGLWFDQNDIPDGTVASWVSRDGKSQALVSSGTAPTKSSSGVLFGGAGGMVLTAQKAQFVRRCTVPDSTFGMSSDGAGKGFTCTGLCRIPGTSQFWIGNHGDTSAGHSGAGPWSPSLVRVDYTNGVLTKLQEIGIAALISGAQSIQGVTFDTSDNTLWFAMASGSNLKVYHITQAGTLLSDTITPSWAPNGLAYIPAEDALWIGENPSVNNNYEKRSCATGALILNPATTNLSNQDMMFYDGSTGELLYSDGANGVPGILRAFATSGTSGALVNVGSVTFDAHADTIEGGVVREGNRVFLTSDAFYHSGSDLLNQFIEYETIQPISNVVSVHLTASVSATTSSDCYIEIGGGSDGPLDGFGIGVYPSSTTTLTIAANTAASGTTQRGLINAATVSNMTSMRLIDILFDKTGGAISLYVDGTLVTTGSLSALVGGISTAGQISIGTSIKAAQNRAMTGTIRDAIVVTGAADRQKMEGYRAARWGLQGNLPANHPYKNAAP